MPGDTRKYVFYPWQLSCRMYEMRRIAADMKITAASRTNKFVILLTTIDFHIVQSSKFWELLSGNCKEISKILTKKIKLAIYIYMYILYKRITKS